MLRAILWVLIFGGYWSCFVRKLAGRTFFAWSPVSLEEPSSGQASRLGFFSGCFQRFAASSSSSWTLRTSRASASTSGILRLLIDFNWCDSIWFDSMWFYLIRFDSIWFDSIRLDCIWFDSGGNSTLFSNFVRSDSILFDLIRSDSIWFDSILFDLIRFYYNNTL